MKRKQHSLKLRIFLFLVVLLSLSSLVTAVECDSNLINIPCVISTGNTLTLNGGTYNINNITNGTPYIAYGVINMAPSSKIIGNGSIINYTLGVGDSAPVNLIFSNGTYNITDLTAYTNNSGVFSQLNYQVYNGFLDNVYFHTIASDRKSFSTNNQIASQSFFEIKNSRFYGNIEFASGDGALWDSLIHNNTIQRGLSEDEFLRSAMRGLHFYNNSIINLNYYLYGNSQWVEIEDDNNLFIRANGSSTPDSVIVRITHYNNYDDSIYDTSMYEGHYTIGGIYDDRDIYMNQISLTDNSVNITSTNISNPTLDFKNIIINGTNVSAEYVLYKDGVEYVDQSVCIKNGDGHLSCDKLGSNGNYEVLQENNIGINAGEGLYVDANTILPYNNNYTDFRYTNPSNGTTPEVHLYTNKGYFYNTGEVSQSTCLSFDGTGGVTGLFLLNPIQYDNFCYFSPITNKSTWFKINSNSTDAILYLTYVPTGNVTYTPSNTTNETNTSSPSAVIIYEPLGSYVLNSTGTYLNFNFSESMGYPLPILYDVYLTNGAINYTVRTQTPLNGFEESISKYDVLLSGNYYVGVRANNTAGESVSLSNYTVSFCINQWTPQYTTCVSDIQTKSYIDSNSCSEKYDFPNDNNTIVTCDDGIISEAEQSQLNTMLLILIGLFIIFGIVQLLNLNMVLNLATGMLNIVLASAMFAYTSENLIPIVLLIVQVALFFYQYRYTNG